MTSLARQTCWWPEVHASNHSAAKNCQACLHKGHSQTTNRNPLPQSYVPWKCIHSDCVVHSWAYIPLWCRKTAVLDSPRYFWQVRRPRHLWIMSWGSLPVVKWFHKSPSLSTSPSFVQMNWSVGLIALNVDSCVQLQATHVRKAQRKTWNRRWSASCYPPIPELFRSLRSY